MSCGNISASSVSLEVLEQKFEVLWRDWINVRDEYTTRYLQRRSSSPSFRSQSLSPMRSMLMVRPGSAAPKRMPTSPPVERISLNTLPSKSRCTPLPGTTPTDLIRTVQPLPVRTCFSAARDGPHFVKQDNAAPSPSSSPRFEKANLHENKSVMSPKKVEYVGMAAAPPQAALDSEAIANNERNPITGSIRVPKFCWKCGQDLRGSKKLPIYCRSCCAKLIYE